MSRRSPGPPITDKVAEALTSYSKVGSGSRKRASEQIKDRVRKYSATEDQIPDNLEEVEIDDDDAKIVSERLLRDNIAQQANKYVEYSSVSSEGRRPLELPGSSDPSVIHARKLKKKKKVLKIAPKRGRKEEFQERERAPPPPPPEELIKSMVKKRKLVAPKGKVGDSLRIETFKEAENIGNRERLFQQQMQRLNRQPDKVYTRIPTQEEEFSWVKEQKEKKDTHYAQVAMMIEAEADIPNLPHVTKAKMGFLLHAPDPNKGERPCLYGENCEAYQQWGFCCKEMLPEEYEELVLDALQEGKDPFAVLPGTISMCVICNLKIVTHLYDTNKMGLNRDDPHIIHNFQMYVDIEGEYPSEMTLLGDDKFRGIIAPIIRYDRSNYVQDRSNGIDFLRERACLDFQEGVVSH